MSIKSSMRADAAKNRGKIIAEARRIFSASDAGVSLDAIAKAAGLGIGTLYRHFPDKEALVEAVYSAELDELDVLADQLLSDRSGFDAMRSWLNAYAKFVATKHAMHDALRIALTPKSKGLSETRTRMNSTIGKFLEAGGKDGSIRQHLEPDDVTIAIAGAVYAASTSEDADQVKRVIDLLMNGLQNFQ